MDAQEPDGLFDNDDDVVLASRSHHRSSSTNSLVSSVPVTDSDGMDIDFDHEDSESEVRPTKVSNRISSSTKSHHRCSSATSFASSVPVTDSDGMDIGIGIDHEDSADEVRSKVPNPKKPGNGKGGMKALVRPTF